MIQRIVSSAWMFLLGYVSILNAFAGILPSFDLQSLAWQATDIVVVKGDSNHPGKCIVVEAWKGSSKLGDTLTLPELGAFASDESRTISRWPSENESNLPLRVTGLRMVLFLKKTATASWEAAARFGG